MGIPESTFIGNDIKAQTRPANAPCVPPLCFAMIPATKPPTNNDMKLSRTSIPIIVQISRVNMKNPAKNPSNKDNPNAITPPKTIGFQSRLGAGFLYVYAGGG